VGEFEGVLADRNARTSPAETYCAAYTGSTKMKLFSGVI